MAKTTTAVAQLTIDLVAGSPPFPGIGGGTPSVSIGPAAFWVVTGTVVPSPGKPILQMSYELPGEVPPRIVFFAPPTSGTIYTFTLTPDDISDDGTYLLVVHAYDVDGDSSTPVNIEAIGVSAPTGGGGVVGPGGD